MANDQDPNESAQQNQMQAPPVIFDEVPITYVNFCRGTLSPEEVILDLGFNPNAFGVKVLAEDVEIKNRILMTPAAAKRLLMLLSNIVQNHEQNFGEIEVDFRRRLKNQPAGVTRRVAECRCNNGFFAGLHPAQTQRGAIREDRALFRCRTSRVLQADVHRDVARQQAVIIRLVGIIVHAAAVRITPVAHAMITAMAIIPAAVAIPAVVPVRVFVVVAVPAVTSATVIMTVLVVIRAGFGRGECKQAEQREGQQEFRGPLKKRFWSNCGHTSYDG